MRPARTTSSSTLSASQLRGRYQGCSFRLVSFRFSSLRISLRYARGDLGAQPPTRELVNYFAQRDTSFMVLPSILLAPAAFLPPSGSHVRALSHPPSHVRSRFLSFCRARDRLAYDICSEVQSGGGGSFQVATKCISRWRASALFRPRRTAVSPNRRKIETSRKSWTRFVPLVTWLFQFSRFYFLSFQCDRRLLGVLLLRANCSINRAKYTVCWTRV